MCVRDLASEVRERMPEDGEATALQDAGRARHLAGPMHSGTGSMLALLTVVAVAVCAVWVLALSLGRAAAISDAFSRRPPYDRARR
jgi:hypothetical protein